MLVKEPGVYGKDLVSTKEPGVCGKGRVSTKELGVCGKGRVSMERTWCLRKNRVCFWKRPGVYGKDRVQSVRGQSAGHPGPSVTVAAPRRGTLRDGRTRTQSGRIHPRARTRDTDFKFPGIYRRVSRPGPDEGTLVYGLCVCVMLINLCRFKVRGSWAPDPPLGCGCLSPRRCLATDLHQGQK